MSKASNLSLTVGHDVSLSRKCKLLICLGVKCGGNEGPLKIADVQSSTSKYTCKCNRYTDIFSECHENSGEVPKLVTLNYNSDLKCSVHMETK